MWRRSYLLLLLVRIYFALSPSYLHPDENFQGPEVIAGWSIVLLLPQITLLTDEGVKASFSPILCKRRGNGPRPTQSEVFFRFGLSTAFL